MQKHSRAYFQKKESANCVCAHGSEKECARALGNVRNCVFEGGHQ